MTGFSIFASLVFAQAAAQPLAPADRDRVPRLLSIPPVSEFYPREALATAQQGVTRLRCRLLVAGTLVDCFVQESSGFSALDGAALKLASHARYSPLIENDVARDTDVILPIRWVIPG